MRNLRNVTSADVEACRTMALDDMATLTALLTGVTNRVTALRPDHADDVASLASATVARLYSGATSVDHAVNAAVSLARAAVQRAYVLAAWDTYGDMTDAVNVFDAMGDTVTTLRASATPRPDSIADATPADYLFTLGRNMSGKDAAAWQDMVTAWLAHDEDTCPRCDKASGVRVSPMGIVAHMAGLTGDATRPARRAAGDAVESARPVMLALVTQYAPRPAGSGKDRQVSPVTPRHKPVVGMVNGRDLSPAEAFTVRYAACKAMRSHGVDALGYPSPLGYGAAASFLPCDCPATVRHDGEQYGVSSAPASSGDRTDSGMVRSFKPVVSPRKRGGNSTGPTVNAW